MSLDPVTVFREVFAQVRKALDVDAFYVASADLAKGMLTFRYLYENGHEMEPEESPSAGTLAGICVERDQPILLRDADKDRARLGLPERNPWGTLRERSLIVAPLRLQGKAVGAISVQSVKPNAYDQGDLELLAAIGNEAAIAIERADLYERTTRCHGACSTSTGSASSCRLTKSWRRSCGRSRPTWSVSSPRRRWAIYLDGGDNLEFAVTTGTVTTDVRSIPKGAPTVSRVIESGDAIEFHDEDGANESTRASLQRPRHKTVFIQPLRVADRLIGVFFVDLRERHPVTVDERELLGVIAGHRLRADPRHPALSGARRRVPLDREHAHRDDRRPGPVPRGSPASRRRGRRRARRTAPVRRRRPARSSLRVDLPFHRQDRHPRCDPREARAR
jgi:transcriptional regulator with GAF, ATPase, and Fis domain